jgi:uncharacterized protein YjbK
MSSTSRHRGSGLEENPSAASRNNPQRERSQEVEIKLRLLSEQDWSAVWVLAPHREAPVLQENTFYDTPDLSLERAGWRLRVRRQWRLEAGKDRGVTQTVQGKLGKGEERKEIERPQVKESGRPVLRELTRRSLDGVVLTLKGRSRHRGSAAIRPELEKALEPEEWKRVFSPDVRLGELWDWGDEVSFLKTRALEDLVVLGRFENVRATLRVPLQEEPRVLELDRTVFSDGHVDYEVEMELPPPVENDFLNRLEVDLKRFLSRNGVAYGRSPGGKFTRALKRGDRNSPKSPAGSRVERKAQTSSIKERGKEDKKDKEYLNGP